ncbi:hypothetical protein CTAYLR_003932 [Chrysophaeum taylorii]|uniref:Uncharacterized protein n=1 Tax=Chrysophaeum taylorii TaxID=2483200 RepID=A0AAD7UB61_9STRA|nr:hypothetical protein CTAYLR_003932 [Chrysophaeum taylorii]
MHRLEALDAFFSPIFGSRWENIRRGLAEPRRHVAWVNPFTSRDGALVGDGWEVTRHSGCSLLVRRGGTTLLRGGNRSSHYALDGASALAALAVAPVAGDRVLDLCAAPGGKALVLAGQLRDGGGALIANEKVAARRTRLRRVLETYLPGRPLLEARDVPRAQRLDQAGLHVAVAGIDATDRRAFRTLPFAFDKILVDAPCSGERYFVHGASDHWSASRVKRDAKLQLAILRGAVVALGPRGRLVYCTCSIAPGQNDDVVDKFLNKVHKSTGRRLRVDDPLANLPRDSVAAGAERTSYGAMMLPDTTPYGPLYWTVLAAEESDDGGWQHSPRGKKARAVSKATPRRSSIVEGEVPLEPGTEVMRRCAVREAMKCGREHLRGTVVRVEDRGVVVAWAPDGVEEMVSRRRAQTFADAFQRLPRQHDYRRRKAQPTTSTRKKRRSDPKSSETRQCDPEVEVPPETTTTTTTNVDLPPPPPPPQEQRDEPPPPPDEEPDDTPQTTHPRETFSSSSSSGNIVTSKRSINAAVDELRQRKADPEQSVDWHGGPGFGSSGHVWINVGLVRYDVHSAKPWNKARDHCREKGGELAKVRDNDANDALIRLAKSRGYVSLWLGAQDKGTEGDWLWIVDRERLDEGGFAAWCEGGPTNFAAGADCLLLSADVECWIDDLCALHVPYACETPIDDASGDAFARVDDAACRADPSFDDGVMCTTMAPSSGSLAADSCWASCESSYPFSLAVATYSPANSTCCCSTRCSCLERDVIGARTAIATDNPGPFNDASEIQYCDVQALETYCARYGYYDTSLFDADRVAVERTACDAVAAADERAWVECCCAADETRCCPNESAESCAQATYDDAVVASFRRYAGVSCARRDDLDDGELCFELAYAQVDPWYQCWNYCQANYPLRVAAAYGVPADNQCCCVTACACYEEEDGTKMAIADDLPGPSNDANDVKLCDDDDDIDDETAAANAALVYATRSAVRCRSGVVEDHETCSEVDYRASSNAGKTTRECWDHCANTFDYPLAASYADPSDDACCCISQCVCYDQDDAFLLAIAVDAPGILNDANEVESCEDLVGDLTDDDRPGPPSALVVTLSVLFALLCSGLVACVCYRERDRVRRAYTRFVPTAILFDRHSEDNHLIVADDVEITERAML